MKRQIFLKCERKNRTKKKKEIWVENEEVRQGCALRPGLFTSYVSGRTKLCYKKKGKKREQKDNNNRKNWNIK